MRLFVRNSDKADTVLVQAVPRLEDKMNIINFGEKDPNPTPSRVVLRPGEEDTFVVEDGFILAMEKL